MNRRQFLQCAALLVSGTAASAPGLALSGEQRRHLLEAPEYIAGDINYFTPAQRGTLAMLTETIIPRTDTPGAVDAGVPRFIELMVADWFDESERAIFDTGLEALILSAMQIHGRPFEALEERQRLAMLEALEAEAGDAQWYAPGGAERSLEAAPFICQLKELTAWGFFTSRVGATEVLRYNPMPMTFDGDRPLDPGASSWSTRMTN